MTVLKVEILLWYCYSPHDYPNIDDAPAVKDAIRELVGMDMLMPLGDLIPNTTRKKRYTANKGALDVYVKKVLAIPLPKNVWV